MIFRIAKVLNHNSFIGIDDGKTTEYLVMGKGVAFGKKVSQTVETGPDIRVYSLNELTERGEARDIIRSVPPECLELAGEVLDLDAYTGGFNLQIAWSTGYLAGLSMAASQSKEE